ncbi:two-component sensor histidine kinase [Corallincola luteus]|uniref:histidine kinase n=1 Tax=Corallincola luteus TaxID=1775177 RepID=A0ABY2AKL0_9GAMM|nr:ATP-binding protein [Corallincola luteus]TCI02357.1 two-component sensor histidine kinase [Corallincola luteus]
MKRLYLSIICCSLGALFLLGWGFDQIASEADLNAGTSQDSHYGQLADGLANHLSHTPIAKHDEVLTALSADFGITASTESRELYALPAALESQLTEPGGLVLASENGPLLYRAIPEFPELLLQLQLPPPNTRSQTVDLALSIAFYIGLCGTLVLWLWPLTRSLFRLNQAADKIGKGQFQIRVASPRFSYLEKLESSFNHMAAQIEKLMTDNQILARSLSHDIRTPMACLRFGLDAAQDTTDPEKCRGYLSRMDTELSRMEAMTTAFLDYACMEQHSKRIQRDYQNLSELLQELVAENSVIAEQEEVTLTLYHPEQSVLHNFDYHWCYRALQNLVSNAINYARSEVLVSLRFDNTHIHISVEDDGDGIPADQYKTVFTPFVKLATDRSRKEEHYGLGLAIVSRVVEWHGGHVQATNSTSLSGACFEISLPTH